MDSDSQPFIELTTEDSTFRIDPLKVESLTRIICTGLGVDTFELSWDFVDDEAMQQLNRQYREKNTSTDVLSFPQQEWEEPLEFIAPEWPLADSDEDDEDLPPEMLGDVVISPNVALKNARSIGHSLDREVCFLLVHGILHLCGHDHLVPEEEERMTREQQAIMKYLEAVDGAPLWTHCATVEV
ncbi:MAG: rRNA maturation RNase YbeY [Proteobacteria bacterium]|nr:MAG: rRNA maturation RNase YbeY [Pseudomonadota bacterium]